MTKIQIPFCPLPAKVMIKQARRFRSIGHNIANAFPFLEHELKIARIKIEKEIYGAIIFMLSIFYFMFGTLIAYAFAQRLLPENAVLVSIGAGILFTLLVFVQLIFYPKIIIKKRIRDLERNLVFALRTILVEIKSGVTLFDSINIVAQGDNGEVSHEFKSAIEKIETGTFQNDALEDLAENNPSIHFRRAIWQMVNGLKAGSDVGIVMTALVENLAKEKANQVRGYGNSLKLLSLLYMMLGAIIPALGLTFLIVLSSFPQVSITETVFWAMLGFIGLGQFMYLGIIKSSRPTLMGD